jgi:hypothetical protein
MIAALICVAFACKDDEEKPTPLVKAYVEVAAADATQLLPGDAGTKTFTVESNRELEVSSDVAWCTVSVSGKTVTLTYQENSYVQGTKPAKRVGTVTVKAKAVNADDNVVDAKANVNVDQALFGLPEAKLLDVVFNATGATDISPLANKILNVKPFNKDFASTWSSYQEWCSVQEYPDYRQNPTYGRYTAFFHGGQDENAADHVLALAGDNTKRGRMGSCCLRVDYADYSKAPANFSYQSTDVLPLNELGKGIYNEQGYSMECLFRPAPWENRRYVFSSTQTSGNGFEVDNNAGGLAFSFYVETCLKNQADGSGIKEPSAANADVSVKYQLSAEELAATDRFYHFVGTWTAGTNAKMRLYLNGKAVRGATADGPGDWEHTNAGTGEIVETTVQANHVMRRGTPGAENGDALAQYYAIGGNARTGNHPELNKGWQPIDRYAGQEGMDWAERLFIGEIVLCRIYDKPLEATDVQFLYDYERPE